MDEIEQLIKALPAKEKEEDPEFYGKIEGRLTLKRAAALAWMSQFEAAIVDYEKAQTFKGVFCEDEIQTMKHDLSVIKVRK